MCANRPIPRPTAANCDWEPPRKTRGALRALDPLRPCGSPLVDLAYAAAIGILIGAAVALTAAPASTDGGATQNHADRAPAATEVAP